jgi:AcrR family transcriptional regulator
MARSGLPARDMEDSWDHIRHTESRRRGRAIGRAITKTTTGRPKPDGHRGGYGTKCPVSTDLRGSPGAQRRQRAGTRDAILAKARELIGAGERLTTVSLTRAVGVTQPAFYSHFRNVDECEREVFREVGERLRRMHGAQRRTLVGWRALEKAAIQEHLESIIGDLLENAVVFGIAQRRRHESTVMGDVVREVEAGARAELAADVQETMKELHAPIDSRTALLHAELIQASVNAGVETLIAGRHKDVPFVAGQLAQTFVAWLRAIVDANRSER